MNYYTPYGGRTPEAITPGARSNRARPAQAVTVLGLGGPVTVSPIMLLAGAFLIYKLAK